jgi:hypothetical protein
MLKVIAALMAIALTGLCLQGATTQTVRDHRT